MLITHDSLDFIHVTTDEELEALVNLVDRLGDELVAVDSESYPLKQYGSKASALDPHTSKVRLISLFALSWEYPYVVDVEAVDPDELIDALCHVDKVSHYAVHDLKAFRSSFGRWLPRWFCSQVADLTLSVSNGWKAAQFRGHALDDLARDYFGVFLDKTLGKSDWSNPKLDIEQLVYSAIDVAAPKGSNTRSIVLDSYSSLLETCKDLDELAAFQLDQAMVRVLARVEYAGVPMNTKVLQAIYDATKPKVVEKQLALCKSLEFPVQQRLYKNDTGELDVEYVVPDWAATLLNNNKGLVAHVDKSLRAKTGKGLDNLRAETLSSTLKDLSNDDDEDCRGALLELDFGLSLINDLLDYKRNIKLISEAVKYLDNINPVTGCLHTGLKPVGTSTSRMASSGRGDVRINLQQISTVSLDIDIDEGLYYSESLVV